MFSLNHILFMVLTGLSIYVIISHLKEKSSHGLDLFMRRVTLLVLCFDPIYWIWEWRQFQFLDLASTLPLYICSLFWIMLPIAVYSKPSLLKRIALSNICTVGLLGGVFGLVFNTYLNQYPFMSFVPMRSLLYHFLMILVSCSMWATGYYKPKAGDALLSHLPLLAILLPSIILSQLFGWDYCFVAGGIGTPLEMISRPLPRPLYFLVLYGGISLVIICFFKRMSKGVSDL